MIIKKTFLSFFAILMSLGIWAQNKETIKINEDLKLIHLQDSIFIHVSYHSLEEFGRFPSNGLLIIKNRKAIMIDTPMDNEKTEMLVSFLKNKMDVEVTKLIIGHHHKDCMGGLEFLQSIGVESIAHELTITKCQELDLAMPSTSFQENLSIDFYGEEIICRYFGAGHSIDNITVYLPQEKLLFGGCLIKAMGSNNLGYTGDAVLEDWAGSVQNVLEAYPEIQTVVPGHGAFGGKYLLSHTIDLIKNH